MLQDAGEETPDYLQRDLLRLTAHLGLTEEHDRLLESFTVKTWPEHKQIRDQSEVIFIYHQGLVSLMEEKAVHIFSPELSHMIRIAVPGYSLQTPYVYNAWLSAEATEVRTELVENIDTLARDNLNARMPGITARTMARVVAKKVAASNAADRDAFAGLLLDIAGLVSERADTRSWSSLPASIQIARIAVTAGEHRLHATARRTGFMTGDLDVERTVNLAAGQINIISIHDIAN